MVKVVRMKTVGRNFSFRKAKKTVPPAHQGLQIYGNINSTVLEESSHHYKG